MDDAAGHTAQPANTVLVDFTGRAVIVTGGTRGIGRGIAEAFLATGADGLVCGRNEAEQPPEGGGRRAVFPAADVRDAAQAATVTQAAVDAFGRLDVLVNNAGGAPNAGAAPAA